MMGFYTQVIKRVGITSDMKRDDQAGPNFVTLQKLSWGARQAVMGANLRVTASTKGSQRVAVNAASMETDQLVAAVKAMEGPDFEGRPLSRENILALPPEVIAVLREANKELQQGLEDDEKKESTKPTE